MDSIAGPLADLIDRAFPDPRARERAGLEPRQREEARETDPPSADPPSADPWTRRARPAFLYVMYALLLWSIRWA